MSEIICVDAKFSQEVLNFFSLHGVVVPEQDKIYSIRNVIINSNGKTGIHLEEIVNPKVPINHPLFPGEVVYMEVNFDISRFRTLNGDNINVSEIKQLIKEKSLT